MRQWLQKRYGKALGGHIYRALDVVFWIVFFLVLLALTACSQTTERRQTWLIVVYLPYAEHWVPHAKFYYIDREVCMFEAMHIYGPGSKTKAFCVP